MHTPSSQQAADLDRVAERIARQFLPNASDLRLTRLGQGLINDTRLVEAYSKRFVLQRINGAVFKDPEAIAANLLRVQDWLRDQGDRSVRLPRLLCAKNGAATLRDDDNQAWRLIEFIENSRTLRPLEHPAQAAEVGRILGRFHRALAGLDPSRLRLTLPELHDTARYWTNLKAALATPQTESLPGAERQTQTGTGMAAPATTKSPLRRRPDAVVMAAIQQIESRARLIPVLQQAAAAGIVSPRVTHGDPKLDNVLFAGDADRALCLIDLDTVQPGLWHHDLADCLRSCCNRIGSASADGPAVSFDLGLCEALLGGYAEEAAPLFDDETVALLYPAIRLIPVELAMRFLTDYLEGDRYFRVSSPRQNLDKAMIQLALVSDIEEKRGNIEHMIRNCFRRRDQQV